MYSGVHKTHGRRVSNLKFADDVVVLERTTKDCKIHSTDYMYRVQRCGIFINSEDKDLVFGKRLK